MNFRALPFVILFIFCTFKGLSQGSGIAILDSSRDCSFRGMSIPANGTIWVSGSKGHVGRSTDGGTTWRWSIVTGYEKSDFRDIHAFDSLTAVIMGIGNPAYILKTRDGGLTWKQVFTKEAPGMFLDAMDFRNGLEGICIGDPLTATDGTRRFFVIRSSDAGETWKEETLERRPRAQEGEAVFSASGTNIALLDSKVFDYAFISGGLVSNLYVLARKRAADKVFPVPVLKGSESAGAFSMATDRRKTFYCIGGDYKKPELGEQAFAFSRDGGSTWQTSATTRPGGYRSCISMIAGKRLVACGTNGVDILLPGPDKWQHISRDNFNVCVPGPDGRLIFFAGGNGRIGMMRI